MMFPGLILVLMVKKMFKSMSSEGHLSSGQSSSSLAGHGVTPPGLESQESSWIGLLSVVSRPAMSFLQKYLPTRIKNFALPENGSGWMTGELNSSFVDEEREFLKQLGDMMPLTQHPASHLTYLQCEHHGAGGTLPWLTADSLREIGIQSAEELDLNLCQQTQFGYVSSVRTVLSLSSVSSQEIKPSGRKDWARSPVSSSGGKSRTWWGSFWGGEDSLQKGLLSDLSKAKESTVSGRLCPQQAVAEINAPAVFVQSDIRGWTQGENTGPTDHKDQQANNAGLHTVQNTETSTPDQHLSISDHLSRTGAAAACSEVAVLTPDQDNGYSSLEEEQVHMCHLSAVNDLGKEPQHQEPEVSITTKTEMTEDISEEGESTSGKADEEEEEVKKDEENEEAATEDALATPQCQNKAIAFIMGCPCSDDDSNQSDGESSVDDNNEDDDDDGFDSEGSSGFSDSSDEEDDDDDDDADSDSEADSEAERLWTSLCQSSDPYNPRNFTARLQTHSTPPRTIPATTPPSSTQSTPASSPDFPASCLAASPPLTSSSPPSGNDTWDDSTSASEVDEAESLRLWSSFSCSSDPYSPLNFQATVRTRGPESRARAKSKRASKTSPQSPHPHPTSPPEYRKEEAEERFDSGFSEPCTSTSPHSCRTSKKVRFCDDVEEFFASCSEEEEDRRGPWEELARDRCRFLRRCQEVEQSIAYCLQPQHRSLVYQRLTVLYVQKN
ncbi:protein phosphatase 1 regulatory subunit 15B [Xyrichtys novacula]|uniref:Protein phosphatase 1 regulatory subunit 15B n=1 Tax=Xyrichtys novacula TaxID=13765 RepID=A0AAV1ERE0_XYRNO|nr:protein phosphatase 1 regulatory subunit 15B [Xyrichtys novacula]